MTEKKITKKEQERLNKLPIDMYDDNSVCRRCLKLLGDTMEYNCKPGEFIQEKKRANIRLFVVLDTIPKSDYDLLTLERSLEKVCDQTGLKMSEIYVDYAVRCSLHKNIWGFSTVQRKSIVHNCRIYLNGEISRMKPEVVLLMGEISLQSILKQNQIKKWNNILIKHRDLQSYVIPVALEQNKLVLKEEVINNIAGAFRKPITFKSYKKQFVKTETQLNSLISKLEKSKVYSVDTETNTLDRYEENACVLGIAISIDGKTGYFVPVQTPSDHIVDESNKSYWDFNKDYWKPELFKKLKKQLERKDITIILHADGFDWNFLSVLGFNFRGKLYDTMIGSSVLYDFENGLKPLAWIHTDFGGYDDELDELLPVKSKGYYTIDPEVLSEYACFDGVATLLEYRHQQSILKTHAVRDFLPELMQLRINLSRMEIGGCRISLETAIKLKNEYEEMLDDIAANMRVLLDVEEINLNSPTQLLKAFYPPSGLLEFVVNRSRKKPSTDKKLLQYILPQLKRIPVKTKKEQKRRDDVIESISLLSDYRKYSKYLTTYIMPFIENSVDGYYHHYHTVHVTKTGRLSGNMQQSPRKGGIRDCIIADDDCDLVELDFSQAEMRVAAEYSGDEKLLAILNDRDSDIHSEVGVVSIKKPDGSSYEKADFKDNEIAEELRPKAKIVGFSILYGKTEVGLSEDLNCSTADARKVIQYLLDGFPGLKTFIADSQQFVREYGYIDTLFGRRLFIPEGLSTDAYTLSEADRYAVNYPVQSTSSDILVLALNRLQRRIDTENWHPKTRLILTVHDSILIQTHKSQTKKFIPMAKAEMESPIPQLKLVKMFADAKVGKFWGSGMDKA